MVDDADVPATEPEEAAQDAAPQEPASEAPPWGDDFDAERAWKTIQNLRQFEKRAKEFDRIESDDDARATWLKSQGYEFADTETDDPEQDDGLDFEDDQPKEHRDPRVDEILAREERRAIRDDLDAISAGSDWALDDHDRMVIEAWARQDPKGFDKPALERAHEKYLERLEGIASKGVERAKKPKPKPDTVVKSGTAATEVPDLDDRNERVRWMVERLQGNAS